MSDTHSEPMLENARPAGLLFDLPAADIAPPPALRPRAPRVMCPRRDQAVLYPLHLEDALPEEHPARVVWEYVQELDLQPWYERIRAVEGGPGRAAIDPKILLALWLYATLDGVGSARQLEELCEQHLAYQWLRGGVGVNYHTLSDFRTAHVAALNELLTQSVAVLRAENLVDLRRVAQDGVRVRASAGDSSFHRRATLEECLKEAAQQVEALQSELAADSAASRLRQQQARRRAARERQQRVAQALAQVPQLAAKKKGAARAQTRVSTTDPEAHVMKMANGGYRPAYNVQFAATTADQVIVGVDVATTGSDLGQLRPMVEQIQQRHEQTPEEMLADGNFAKHEDITVLSQPEFDCTVYSPVKAPNDKTKDPHAPRPYDSPAVAAWRQRMATPEAKAIYRLRAQTAECVNAIARNRGLQQLRVRGQRKVLAVVLWYALAHNLMRTATLRAEAARKAEKGP